MPFLRGTLDADGRARVRLPLAPFKSIGRDLFACAIAFSADASLALSDRVFAVSELTALGDQKR
jgi:hypothetical protein